MNITSAEYERLKAASDKLDKLMEDLAEKAFAAWKRSYVPFEGDSYTETDLYEAFKAGMESS